MKKTIFMAAMAALMTLVGCDNGEEPSVVVDSAISVNPTELKVASSASNNNIEIKATGLWSATTKADWVSLSANGGGSDTQITVIVNENEANEERLTEVEFSCGEKVATLSIEQAAAGSGEGSFDVDIYGSSQMGVYANITPVNYSGTWYIGSVKNSVFEDADGFGGDAELFAEYIMELEIEKYETDLSKVDYKYVFQGTVDEVNMLAGWGGADGTEYAICIFGMNANGDILTDVTLIQASTLDANIGDFTIECLFKNITSSSAQYEIYPSDDETYYVYTFHQDIDSFFENGGTQGELFQSVLKSSASDLGGYYTYLGDFTESGSNPLEIINMPALTSLSFVGFGLDIQEEDGSMYIVGRSSDAQISQFTTLASAPSQNAWSSVEALDVENLEIPRQTATVAKFNSPAKEFTKGKF